MKRWAILLATLTAAVFIALAPFGCNGDDDESPCDSTDYEENTSNARQTTMVVATAVVVEVVIVAAAAVVA